MLTMTDALGASKRAARALCVLSIAVTLYAAGCSEDAPADGVAGQGASDGASTGGNANPGVGVLRCADFLSASDAADIGIEGWDDTATEGREDRGVLCTTRGSTLTVSIFHGEAYGSIIEGAVRAGFDTLDGPKLGSESAWWEAVGVTAVAFKSSNMRYSVNMALADRAVLETIATALAAHLEGP